ncbi:hypothetical protein DPMN_193720 [Dreissena polymorpha]|uniref:Uncharacterized protein n=1 Tax=Dreissena polymorpha TaxID=45954 RepID=A0A9D3Y093_DREPO|nr:hypothetical protein DPMN_193720 [Dreissena polymorpha]
MLEFDIKLRTLRTVRSDKEGGLQSSSVVTMPRSELPVHTPSAISAEPNSERHVQLNIQNNSQTLSDIFVCFPTLHSTPTSEALFAFI